MDEAGLEPEEFDCTDKNLYSDSYEGYSNGTSMVFCGYELSTFSALLTLI